MGVSVPGEATSEGQPAPPMRALVNALRSALAPVTGLLRSLEIDTRMLGMVVALAIIWVSFNIVSGGTFLTARNLWNLSVQSASIAIMATGMGLLIWRGLIFRYAQGQTIAPLDTTFQMLGGGTVGTRVGALGEWPSWTLGIVMCVAIVYVLITSRRRKRRYGFPVRPMWAELLVGAVACGIVLGTVWVANSYPLPPNVAEQYAKEHGIPVPPGGLFIPTGVAFPVVIMLIVTLVVTFLATRRRFGRYVYAIGGNPEAAALAGINVRRTIMLAFALMGSLAAVSAAVQTARLNAAVTSLGVQNELDVISAAGIGGTSFAGGIGTGPGAILGAVVMQSLRSGMGLLLVDSPTPDIVVGLVPVAARGPDPVVRRRGS